MALANVPGKLLSLLLVLGACASLAITAQPPPPPPPPPQPPIGTPTPQANPLDEPIAWLMDARRNFTQVRNYTCTLVKRERVRGIMQEQNVILFSAKVEPFSIYMKWVAPHKMAGQEVVFVKGRNRNMMRVKAKGIIGLGTGFVNIEPNDRRVMEHSRHNILEAGLGNMIEENLKNLQAARFINKTKVRIDKYSFDKRECVRIESVNLERHPQFYCHRSILYLEKESKLPMRLENYDWPVGSAPGDLMEEFSYADLHFNVDMREELFNK